MKITVETVVNASLDSVWQAWNNPDDIKQWNNASEDWHTTRSTVDLRAGGKFSVADGGQGRQRRIRFRGDLHPRRASAADRIPDGRRPAGQVEFSDFAEGVLIRETFDAETENDPEAQREGGRRS